jgi:hypothetical protein
MVSVFRTVVGPEGGERSTAAPESEEATSAGLPAGWTHADLQALADKVYDLMLQDLMLERERGAWG